MIGKLMKYDLKKMLRILVYIYFISLGLAIITRLINIGKDIQAIAIIGYVFSGLTYSAIGSIIVNTFVHILRVFICGFYRDESYLTHTLPVEKNKLLLSKYLSSLIVVFASVFVSFLSLFIMFFSKEFMIGLKTALSSTVAGLNMSLGLLMAIIVLVIFSQICTMMSMAFAAVVRGNMYNQKRVPKGLLWFALFYFGSMIVSIAVIALIMVISGNIADLTAAVMSQSSFVTILISGLVLYAVYSIVFYFICQKWFNKGVNVD